MSISLGVILKLMELRQTTWATLKKRLSQQERNLVFILLGIGYTLSKDGHVRIDIIYRNLSKKSKNLINFLGAIIFGFPLCYLIIFKGYQYFFRSFLLDENSKETGGLPNVYILKFFVFFMGILLFCELLNKVLKFFKK